MTSFLRLWRISFVRGSCGNAMVALANMLSIWINKYLWHYWMWLGCGNQMWLLTAFYNIFYVGLICIMKSNQIPIYVNSGNTACYDRALLAVEISSADSAFSTPTMFCDFFYQIFSWRYLTQKNMQLVAFFYPWSKINENCFYQLIC